MQYTSSRASICCIMAQLERPFSDKRNEKTSTSQNQDNQSAKGLWSTSVNLKSQTL